MPAGPESFEFASIGTFSLRDGKRLMAAFASAHIEFRAEFEDGIDRRSGSMACSYGMGAKVELLVDEKKLDEVEAIQTELFGEFSP